MGSKLPVMPEDNSGDDAMAAATEVLVTAGENGAPIGDNPAGNPNLENCEAKSAYACARVSPTEQTAVKKSDRVSLAAARTRVEVVLLVVVVAVVWVLLALPVVFYHLPSNTDSIRVDQAESCQLTDGNKYTGSVCRETLLSCLEPGASNIYISPSIDQEEAESSISTLKTSLKAFGASLPCREAAIPFYCLYSFGLCNSNDTLPHSPSVDDCLFISTDVCEIEWLTASRLMLVDLPVCAELPDQVTLTCNANTSNTSFADAPTSDPLPSPSLSPSSSSSNSSSSSSSTDGCTVDCRDTFYCTPNNTCNPRCGSWEQNSRANVLSGDVAVIASACIGIVSSVAVFIIMGLRRKQLLVFPSIIVLYMTSSLFVLAVAVIISFMDRSGLFCSSIDLIESLNNTTPFCTFAGVLFYYILFQLALWWFFHVFMLFWKAQFPFHARSFQRANQMKYVHAAMIIIALVVPVVPVIAGAIDGGYAISRFPPLLCTATSADATFYSLILPIILLLQCGISMLVDIFWIFHKHHGLFRERNSNNPVKISAAERKILIVFLYYVILGVVALTAFSIAQKDSKMFLRNVTLYFLCESTGVSSSCDRSSFENLSNTELTSMSYVLLGLFPTINLVYVINIQELSRWCRIKVRRSEDPSSTERPSVTSTSTSVATTTEPRKSSYVESQIDSAQL